MDDFQAKPLNDLFYWVRERENVRKKKEAGKLKPWTDDPILQGTRFCCVRRMDDKVSKWLLREWYPSPDKTSGGQMLADVGMARLINWPDTLDAMKLAKLNVEWNPMRADEVMRLVRAEGKLFTGAYIINGMAGQDKIKTVVGQFDCLFNHPELVVASSMQETHKQLQRVKGIGSFIAGQMVADLRHVWRGPWEDRHTWAPLGPGSRRGIAWLTGWNGTDFLPSMQQKDFEEGLTRLLKLFNKKVPAIMKDRGLEAHDIQNCLCEADKFFRLKFSTGRAKNKYPGV